MNKDVALSATLETVDVTASTAPPTTRRTADFLGALALALAAGFELALAAAFFALAAGAAAFALAGAEAFAFAGALLAAAFIFSGAFALAAAAFFGAASAVADGLDFLEFEFAAFFAMDVFPQEIT